MKICSGKIEKHMSIHGVLKQNIYNTEEKQNNWRYIDVWMGIWGTEYIYSCKVDFLHQLKLFRVILLYLVTFEGKLNELKGYPLFQYDFLGLVLLP